MSIVKPKRKGNLVPRELNFDLFAALHEKALAQEERKKSGFPTKQEWDCRGRSLFKPRKSILTGRHLDSFNMDSDTCIRILPGRTTISKRQIVHFTPPGVDPRTTPQTIHTAQLEDPDLSGMGYAHGSTFSENDTCKEPCPFGFDSPSSLSPPSPVKKEPIVVCDTDIVLFKEPNWF